MKFFNSLSTMFSSYDEFLHKPDNRLFDEGISYCRKQQFEKAYQCFKKHLSLNRFCQETIQMLSYCQYKFSEGHRNNVNDLSDVIEYPKSCQRPRKKESSFHIDQFSTALVQKSKFRNDFSSRTLNCRSTNTSSNLSQPHNLLSVHGTPLLKNKSSSVSSADQLSELSKSPKNSILSEDNKTDDFRTKNLLRQLADYQSETKLFLKNIDNTLSRIEVQVNFLITEEHKINSGLSSVLNLFSNNGVPETKRSPSHLKPTSVTLGKTPVSRNRRSSPFRKKLSYSPVTPRRSYIFEKPSFYTGASCMTVWPTFYDFSYLHYNEQQDLNFGRACTQPDCSSFHSQFEHGMENSVPSTSVAKSTNLSTKDIISPENKLVCDVSFLKQNSSVKRKLDFPEIDFDCLPRKKFLLSTLLKNAIIKKKLDYAKEYRYKKRSKLQKRSQSFWKSISLNCTQTFKMFRELSPASGFDSGSKVRNLKKPQQEPHVFSMREEAYLNNVSLGSQSIKHATTQTDLSLDCSMQLVSNISSDRSNSMGTVSLIPSSSIIQVNIFRKKVGVVSTNYACPPNRLNIFINEILSEIKDSLSIFSIDCVPSDLDTNRLSLSINPVHDMNFVLMPASLDYPTNFNLQLLVRGHYIEFPNLRIYQVDPFWSCHSTRDNSQSLCLSQLENRSSFVYPVCVLLYSLSTDLYNFTLLAGPFRIRFVNFNSYFDVNSSSYHRDS